MFSVLLNETKGFKYQITVKVLLKKYKLNGEIEFAPVYFNSVTKTVINHRFRLENSFQEILFTKTVINHRFKLENSFLEILYMIGVWINKWSTGMLNQSSLSTLTFPPIDL